MTNKKTALVTGASKGFGYSLAERLAQRWMEFIHRCTQCKTIAESEKTFGTVY